jgi:hypothetical protein
MRAILAALVFSVALSCGGSSRPAAATSGNGLQSNPCGYVSTSDFKSTLGLPLVGYRSGESCSYRDQTGDTCQVTVRADIGQYASSRSAAANYGPLETLSAGSGGFYSAQSKIPGVWIFDFGFMEGNAFAGALCGARFAAGNPKTRVELLADLIASRI